MKKTVLALAALSLFLPAAHAQERFAPFGIELGVPASELSGELTVSGNVATSTPPQPNPLLTDYVAEINAAGVSCKVVAFRTGEPEEVLGAFSELHANLVTRYPSMPPFEEQWNGPRGTKGAAFIRGDLDFYAETSTELPYPLTRIGVAAYNMDDYAVVSLTYYGEPCDEPAEKTSAPSTSSGL